MLLVIFSFCISIGIGIDIGSSSIFSRAIGIAFGITINIAIAFDIAINIFIGFSITLRFTGFIFLVSYFGGWFFSLWLTIIFLILFFDILRCVLYFSTICLLPIAKNQMNIFLLSLIPNSIIEFRQYCTNCNNYLYFVCIWRFIAWFIASTFYWCRLIFVFGFKNIFIRIFTFIRNCLN